MKPQVLSLVNSFRINGFSTTCSWIFQYILIKVGATNYIKINNKKICIRRISSDFAVFREVFFDREYELEYPDNIQYIIDAGANIGLASICLSLKFPNAKIYAIEPDKSNYAQLLINTKPYPNIYTFNNAIWYQNEQLNLSNSETDGTAGIRVLNDANLNTNLTDGIAVDDLLTKQQIPQIDIFKIDIEGSEKELFTFNTNWLQITKMIIIETHDRLRSGTSQALFHSLDCLKYDLDITGEKFVIKIA